MWWCGRPNIIAVQDDMIDPFEKNKKDIQTMGERKRTWNRIIMEQYLTYEKPVAYKEIKDYKNKIKQDCYLRLRIYESIN